HGSMSKLPFRTRNHFLPSCKQGKSILSTYSLWEIYRRYALFLTEQGFLLRVFGYTYDFLFLVGGGSVSQK
ncbi:MAG: hypothetical protein IJX91_02555, partial [Clostridia bacterium]|nr:hypothetical protein [Clostridia bacterium]